MSKNLLKCLRCGKALIQEEQIGHTCTPVLKGTKHLEIDYWWQSKTDNGETLLMVKGLDGYIYRLTQRREGAKFMPLPDETLQGDESDKDLTEPGKPLC